MMPVSSMHVRTPAAQTLIVCALAGTLLATPGWGGFCGDNEPATPVPECVDTATGEAAACDQSEVVRLWPEALRPGRPGLQLPARRDSTQWRSFTPPDANSGHELFLAVDVEDDYLYVAYNVGIQIWSIAGSDAEDPRRRRAFDLYRGDFMTFIPDGENDFWIDDIAAINPVGDGGDDVLIGLTGKDGVGFSIWKHTKEFDVLEQLYQDLGTDTRTVEILEVDGTPYAFAGSFTGVHVYDLNAATQLAAPCLDDKGTVCPGIYRGHVGNLSTGFYTSVIEQGGRIVVAASTGGNGTDAWLELWEVGFPETPSNAGLLYRGPLRDVRGAELFRLRGATYLAVNEPDGANRRLRIYDVTTCIATGDCSGLANSEWDTVLPSWPSNISWLTYSESHGRPYLYYGFQSENIEGAAGEQLFDLSTLGTTNQIVEITADGGSYTDPCNGERVDYWGTYYSRNHNGLRNLSPQAGRFNGSYFYRAGFGLLDVHVRQAVEPPAAIFADGFESGDTAAWTSTGGS